MAMYSGEEGGRIRSEEAERSTSSGNGGGRGVGGKEAASCGREAVEICRTGLGEELLLA